MQHAQQAHDLQRLPPPIGGPCVEIMHDLRRLEVVRDPRLQNLREKSRRPDFVDVIGSRKHITSHHTSVGMR